MSSAGKTRRDFLKESVAAAGVIGGTLAVSGCPTTGPVIAPAAMGVPGANDRISIGIIGTGDRGNALMGEINNLAKEQNVEITALCDVWKVNLEASAARVKEWFGKEPRKFTRFGDLLALKDVDAVVIATPDYAHCPIMIEALRHGKDVYCEKPMALEVENANIALDLARQCKRVVQVGTQRRSDGHFKAAAKVVASGVLGHVSRISAANHVNHPRWLRGYDNCKKEDIDWDAMLFNRPKVPFDPKLFRLWHLTKIFTNGLPGLWMPHLVDGAHMVMGVDYPASAVAHGGLYVWKENREHCDTFHALVDYPEGFLFSWGMGLGNAAGNHFTVHGRMGTLDLNKWELSGDGGDPKEGIKEITKIKSEANESHMGNWLECMRTRKRPNGDIQFGHQHAVATIMSATALETGRRQKYDPQRRRIYAG